MAPGPIADTEGMRRLSNADTAKTILKSTPLQRYGKTHEIAGQYSLKTFDPPSNTNVLPDATIYLFSSAGDYVTGDIIVVDGGSWHRQGGEGMGMTYPEAVISQEVVQGVSGMKKDKSKL